MFIYQFKNKDALIKKVWVHGSTLTIFYDQKNHDALNSFTFKFINKNNQRWDLVVTGEHIYHDEMAHARKELSLFGLGGSTDEHIHFDLNRFVTGENLAKLFAEIQVAFPKAITTEEITALIQKYNSYSSSISQMQDMLKQFNVGMGSIMFQTENGEYNDPYAVRKCPETQILVRSVQPTEQEIKNIEATAEFKTWVEHGKIIKDLSRLMDEEINPEDSAAQVKRLEAIQTLCQAGLRLPKSNPASVITNATKDAKLQKTINSEFLSMLRISSFDQLEAAILRKAEIMLKTLKQPKVLDSKNADAKQTATSVARPTVVHSSSPLMQAAKTQSSVAKTLVETSAPIVSMSKK